MRKDQAMGRVPRRVFMTLAVSAALLTACGSDSPDSAPSMTTVKGDGAIVAQVAGYDHVAGRHQRFLVGLLGNDSGLVGYGEIDLAFSYLGTEDKPISRPLPGLKAKATYRLVPGQTTSANTAGPRPIKGSEGVGVYAADDVLFDKPGFWQVLVTAELEGRPIKAEAKFAVVTKSGIPFIGDTAPLTKNLLPGDPEAPSTAIDSRAEGATVPDPELHRVTIADAIAARRPVMVVISTPVYCVSRFCGPITDAVAALAREHGKKMDFVHIEVWRDFEGKVLNRAAAEWIFPEGAQDANEPWVFLVGADGKIAARWDNVASENEMKDAITKLLGP